MPRPGSLRRLLFGWRAGRRGAISSPAEDIGRLAGVAQKVGAERKDSVTVTAQPGVVELLEQAGAHPRGNRHDCPKCGGFRTVAHSEEAFYCHKCQWKGNAVTLQKELGIYQRLPSAEYRELSRKRERAHEAALRLYRAAHAHQLELREELRSLGRAELVAHEAGPDDPSAWDILGAVYQARPEIERKLDLLETGTVEQIISELGRGAVAAGGVVLPVRKSEQEIGIH